jgi:hypothetical protein
MLVGDHFCTPMKAATAVFLVTGASLCYVHLRAQIPFFRAVSRLETALRQRGIDWSYWLDFTLRQRFRSDENAIFKEDDTVEIRAIKQDVIEKHRAIFASLPRLICVGVIGFALTLVAMLAEALVRGRG